jgi:hypothetical protein
MYTKFMPLGLFFLVLSAPTSPYTFLALIIPQPSFIGFMNDVECNILVCKVDVGI